MPKRTDISSILVVGAVCALAGCTKAEAVAETGEACVERFANVARGSAATLMAGKPVMATYSYDVTAMPAADLKVLMRLGEDTSKSPKGTLVSGASGRALKDFMAAEVEPRGAIFMAADVSIYRTIRPVDRVSQVVATGCAAQGPGMRLVNIRFTNAGVSDL